VRGRAGVTGGAQGGFTLIETLVAALIVALLATALQSAGRTILATDRAAEESARVTELGLGLLAEIAALPFDDPQAPLAGLGPESGEWGGGITTRALFDDVDDYTVWDGSQALQAKDGAALTMPGYTRAVTIVYVPAGDLGGVSGSATSTKRITVTVQRDGEVAGTFQTLRVQGGRDVDRDR
jgi:prepilin-type N-terminal cleavage/methylation domain-containing protein